VRDFPSLIDYFSNNALPVNPHQLVNPLGRTNDKEGGVATKAGVAHPGKQQERFTEWTHVGRFERNRPHAVTTPVALNEEIAIG
jgi:hypothetical protein